MAMRAATKKNNGILKGIPHVPFEEFSLKRIEDLVAQLEKTKPKQAKVEVNRMEDSHHSPCMQEMTAVMVHDIDEAKESPQIYAMYQYCSVCKTAVRVL